MEKGYQIGGGTQIRNQDYSPPNTDFDLVAELKFGHITRDVDAEVMESGENPEQTRCGNW